MPLILALGRQVQEDLCEFKASLVYTTSSLGGRGQERGSGGLSKKKWKRKRNSEGTLELCSEQIKKGTCLSSRSHG